MLLHRRTAACLEMMGRLEEAKPLYEESMRLRQVRNVYVSKKVENRCNGETHTERERERER